MNALLNKDKNKEASKQKIVPDADLQINHAAKLARVATEEKRQKKLERLRAEEEKKVQEKAAELKE